MPNVSGLARPADLRSRRGKWAVGAPVAARCVVMASNARSVAESITGSWGTGQLDSFTPTMLAAVLTYTIWPWIPRPSRTADPG
jgi:hypothetical protein